MAGRVCVADLLDVVVGEIAVVGPLAFGVGRRFQPAGRASGVRRGLAFVEIIDRGAILENLLVNAALNVAVERGGLVLRIGDAGERAAGAPSVLRGAIRRVGDRIHLLVGVVMPVSPETAPVAAAGQVERHRTGDVVGVLELLVRRVGISDLDLAVEVIVIGRDRVVVRVGDGADALKAVVGKGSHGRDAVERRAGDRRKVTNRSWAAIGVGGGFVLRVLAREHLALRVVGEGGDLSGRVGLGQRLVQRVIGELPDQLVVCPVVCRISSRSTLFGS